MPPRSASSTPRPEHAVAGQRRAALGVWLAGHHVVSHFRVRLHLDKCTVVALCLRRSLHCRHAVDTSAEETPDVRRRPAARRSRMSRAGWSARSGSRHRALYSGSPRGRFGLRRPPTRSGGCSGSRPSGARPARSGRDRRLHRGRPEPRHPGDERLGRPGARLVAQPPGAARGDGRAAGRAARGARRAPRSAEERARLWASVTSLWARRRSPTRARRYDRARPRSSSSSRGPRSSTRRPTPPPLPTRRRRAARRDRRAASRTRSPPSLTIDRFASSMSAVDWGGGRTGLPPSVRIASPTTSSPSPGRGRRCSRGVARRRHDS